MVRGVSQKSIWNCWGGVSDKSGAVDACTWQFLETLELFGEHFSRPTASFSVEKLEAERGYIVCWKSLSPKVSSHELQSH